MRYRKNLICIFCLMISLTNSNGQITPKQDDLKVKMDSLYSQILKDSILVTGWYYIIDTENGFKRQLDKSDETYYIDPRPIVIKDNFSKTEIYETDFKGAYTDYVGLTIRLDETGSDSWAIATERAINKRLALIINNKLVNAPQVNAQITSGLTALNRVEYSKMEIEKFKNLIDKYSQVSTPIKKNTMCYNFLANEDLKSLGLSLLGGVLVILLYRLYLYLRKKLKSFRYKKIFGKDINNDFFIVYGKMLLKTPYDSVGKVEKWPYVKSNGASFRISEPVSFTETKSAKYISDSIAKNTKSASIIISDEEIKNKLDISYCSLGGYNNHKTVDVLKADNNYYVDIDISNGAKVVSKIMTTNSYSIDKVHDYAVIIKLKNKNFPDRTQICVAGLGESGTSGASWFLANKWKELLKRAKRNDFGCIIRVEFGKDESAEIVEMITQKDYKRLNSK